MAFRHCSDLVYSLSISSYVFLDQTISLPFLKFLILNDTQIQSEKIFFKLFLFLIIEIAEIDRW